MNKETFEALKEVVEYMHKELNNIKRISSKYTILIRLSMVERWIHEVKKDYEGVK